jgi:hypothetical protein
MFKLAGRIIRHYVGGFVGTLALCIGIELFTGESTFREKVDHILGYEKDFLKEVALAGGFVAACAGFGLDVVRFCRGWRRAES